MTLNTTTGAALLKECYTKDRVESLVYDQNPFLALLSKKQDVGGKYFDFPVIYGTGARRSATIGTAQTLAAGSSTKSVDFNVPLVRDYAYSRIDGLMLAITRGDMNAFLDAATTEVDMNVQAMSNALASSLYRGGYGSIGTIGSSSGATITLANLTDVVNFEVDEEYVFSASESGDALRDSGDVLVCTAIDRDAGTVTFAENVSTVSGIANGDHIFVSGDRQDSGTPSRLKVSGLSAWIPASAPGSTAFHNVDRSIDTQRLGGMRFTPTEGMPLDQALAKAASNVGLHGGRLTHFLMSYDRMNELENILGSKVRLVDMKVGKVGFTAIQFIAGGSTIECVADRSCPSNKVYGIQLDTWKLISAGPFIQVFDDDDSKALRVSGVDAIEILHKGYCNLICKAPGRNIVVNLAS